MRRYAGGMQEIVLAGGCFWCLDAAYRVVDGVDDVVSGYTGGSVPHPSYELVCTGSTGHAEAVKVVYDEERLPTEVVLDMFFTMHDPRQLNRQGNDVGTQYRSAIYYTTPEQEQTARDLTKIYGDELSRQRLGDITTEIKPSPTYYYAEDHHQQYLAKNPHGYRCHSATGVPFPREA